MNNVGVTKGFEGKYIFYSFRNAAVIAFLPVSVCPPRSILSPRSEKRFPGETPIFGPPGLP